MTEVRQAYKRDKILTPDGEESLEDKPHGDPVKDGSETHGLGEVERTENDLSVSFECQIHSPSR